HQAEERKSGKYEAQQHPVGASHEAGERERGDDEEARGGRGGAGEQKSVMRLRGGARGGKREQGAVGQAGAGEFGERLSLRGVADDEKREARAECGNEQSREYSAQRVHSALLPLRAR